MIATAHFWLMLLTHWLAFLIGFVVGLLVAAAFEVREAAWRAQEWFYREGASHR